jgi:hypothetical protein
MSQHHSGIARTVASPGARDRRRLAGVGAALLAVSGLIFGGVGNPVSAGDLTAGDTVHASAGVEEGCVAATAGTGGEGGSVSPEQDSDPFHVQATGQGTVTVSVCGDDPSDPDGSLPDALDGVVPDDLDDVLPGDPDDVLPGDPDDVIPGDPGGDPGDPGDIVPVDPGEALPGGVGDVVPGGLGGLVADGVGLGRDLIDRAGQIVPPAGGDGPDGGTGGEPGAGAPPAGNGPGSGSASGSVTVNAGAAERGTPPADAVLRADIERDAPASAGATLPRTGGGLGSGLPRLIAVMAVGRALFGLAKRRRLAGAAQG